MPNKGRMCGIAQTKKKNIAILLPGAYEPPCYYIANSENIAVPEAH